MADVQIPAYQELFVPTLMAIDDHGGSATKEEIDERAVEIAKLTPEQVAVEYPPDAQQKGSKVIHRLAWARTYLKKLGVADNSTRGVWTLTDSGIEYLGMPADQAAKDLRDRDTAIRKEYQVAYQAKLKASTASSGGQALSGDGDVSSVEEDAEIWRTDLLNCLLGLTPEGFERLAQRLLREAGFKNVEVTGKSNDGGIDGVGVYKPSLLSFPIFFQCKRYKSSVGPSIVRDFRGAMAGRGEKGLLITTAFFTAEARREATRDGAPPVELIDGTDLCDLLKEYAVGVTTEMVERVKIQEGFFDKL